MSRGLVTDKNGTIISRCMPKFFNYSENKTKIPNLPFKVMEKMDGSLIHIAAVNNKFLITSRGSFDNEYIDAAKEILKGLTWTGLADYTFALELIHPVSRVVLDYAGEKMLYLLAIINTDTGEELELDVADFGFPVVPSIRADSITDLPELPNKEGWVVRWEDGTRVKIKNSEYVRLHRLITGINEKHIWEVLKEGGSIDAIIDNVPDEFFKFVKQTSDRLKEQYQTLEDQAFDAILSCRDIEDRKEFASIVKTYRPELHPIIFAMKDGKPYEQRIWKQLEPKGSISKW